MRAGSAKRRPSNSLRTRKSRYSVNPAMSRAAVRKAKRRYRQNLGWRNIGRILLCCGALPLIAASLSRRNPARGDAQVSPCGDTGEIQLRGSRSVQLPVSSSRSDLYTRAKIPARNARSQAAQARETGGGHAQSIVDPRGAVDVFASGDVVRSM